MMMQVIIMTINIERALTDREREIGEDESD